MNLRESDRLDILCLCNEHMVGGAMSNAGLLASEFSKRGYKAELGFLFENDPTAHHGTDSYFVVQSQKPRTPTDWNRFITGCKRDIIGRRPRNIIGFQPASNFIGALAARYIGDCQMIATQRIPAETLSKRSRRLERTIGSTPLYAHNIAVSETVAKSFSRYPQSYRDKIEVVLNATPPLERSADDRAASRNHFGVRGAELLLGCLGRLHPQKNVPFALDVLASIPGAVLLVAGDGPDEHRLRQKSHDLGLDGRVRFLGSISGQDITRFYAAIDVLLFPSVYEGFGRVLAEAMAMNVPIVGSDIPIVEEVGGQAVLRRPFDAQQWATAVHTVYADETLKADLIKIGRGRAAAFSLPAMVDGYLSAAGLNTYIRQG